MVRFGTLVTSGVSLVISASLVWGEGANTLPNPAGFPDSAGMVQTFSQNGNVDLTGPFFQSFGTNGRSCGSCHRPAQAWTISAEEVKARFEATQGTDPLFRPNDGSVCDHGIDTSTLAGRREAYKLLIERGLIRVTMDVPANAEFDVVAVSNPYGCNEPAALSVYRRPLPSTNLRFLTTVMWEGRESSPETGTQKITFATNPADLRTDLAHQALDATNGHAQASTALSAEQQKAIVEFELGLTTAQSFDSVAGALNADGAKGGPAALASTTAPAFFPGVNDPFGGNPRRTRFTPVIFDMFDAWANLRYEGIGDPEKIDRRVSIARGQALFNSKPIVITGVGGLNDELQEESFTGTCGTCHNTLSAGNHSLPVPLNIGVGNLNSPLDVSYLPVITLQNKVTGAIKWTTDPGRALVSGLWKDVGKLKGPILRGLAARAPYFHNGSARTLADVVTFYEKRFQIEFTPQERQDLIAFLSAL